MIVEQAETDLGRLRSGWPAGSTLARMPEEALRDWLRAGTFRTFPHGRSLYDEQATGSTVFLLLSGCAKVVSRASGNAEFLLAVRRGGDLVGELAALDGGPRPAAVSACGRSPVLACALDGRAFTAVLTECPGAMLVLTASVSHQLRAATRHRVDFARQSSVRLARLITELVAEHGHRLTDTSHLITVDLTQLEIGNLMGVSEPTVFRALKTLREKGMIETRGRRLVVNDLPALRAFIHPPSPEPVG